MIDELIFLSDFLRFIYLCIQEIINMFDEINVYFPVYIIIHT